MLRSLQHRLSLVFPCAPQCCLYLLLYFRSQPLRNRFILKLRACTAAAEAQALWSGLLLQLLRLQGLKYTLCLIKSEWGLVTVEERAAALIHEHYPLFFPHPFASNVAVQMKRSSCMRATHLPPPLPTMLSRVFILAVASED